jgi:hypothetical protein
MQSLRELYQRNGQRERNTSKGNGAVMRCLPFVFAPWILGITEQEATKLAVSSGGLTHDHPESWEAIMIFMSLAFKLLRDGHLSNDTLSKLENVSPKRMANMSVMTVREICDKENTFTAMPALKAAITAFADAHSLADENGPDEAYRGMLVDCCANKGDSDTIGAIAGALWGLVAHPPVQLIARLKERDITVEAVSKTPLREELVTSTVPSAEIQSQGGTTHLLCHPPIRFRTLPELLALLAKMEAIEDPDDNVYDAIADIKKRIDELQAGPVNPGISNSL